jgi:hypothetical protein
MYLVKDTNVAIYSENQVKPVSRMGATCADDERKSKCNA